MVGKASSNYVELITNFQEFEKQWRITARLKSRDHGFSVGGKSRLNDDEGIAAKMVIIRLTINL